MKLAEGDPQLRRLDRAWAFGVYTIHTGHTGQIHHHDPS